MMESLIIQTTTKRLILASKNNTEKIEEKEKKRSMFNVIHTLPTEGLFHREPNYNKYFTKVYRVTNGLYQFKEQPMVQNLMNFSIRAGQYLPTTNQPDQDNKTNTKNLQPVCIWIINMVSNLLEKQYNLQYSKLIILHLVDAFKKKQLSNSNNQKSIWSQFGTLQNLTIQPLYLLQYKDIFYREEETNLMIITQDYSVYKPINYFINKRRLANTYSGTRKKNQQIAVGQHRYFWKEVQYYNRNLSDIQIIIICKKVIKAFQNLRLLQQKVGTTLLKHFNPETDILIHPETLDIKLYNYGFKKDMDILAYEYEMKVQTCQFLYRHPKNIVFEDGSVKKESKYAKYNKQYVIEGLKDEDLIWDIGLLMYRLKTGTWPFQIGLEKRSKLLRHDIPQILQHINVISREGILTYFEKQKSDIFLKIVDGMLRCQKIVTDEPDLQKTYDVGYKAYRLDYWKQVLEESVRIKYQEVQLKLYTKVRIMKQKSEKKKQMEAISNVITEEIDYQMINKIGIVKDQKNLIKWRKNRKKQQQFKESDSQTLFSQTPLVKILRRSQIRQFLSQIKCKIDLTIEPLIQTHKNLIAFLNEKKRIVKLIGNKNSNLNLQLNKIEIQLRFLIFIVRIEMRKRCENILYTQKIEFPQNEAQPSLEYLFNRINMRIEKKINDSGCIQDKSILIKSNDSNFELRTQILHEQKYLREIISICNFQIATFCKFFKSLNLSSEAGINKYSKLIQNQYDKLEGYRNIANKEDREQYIEAKEKFNQDEDFDGLVQKTMHVNVKVLEKILISQRETSSGQKMQAILFGTIKLLEFDKIILIYRNKQFFLTCYQSLRQLISLYKSPQENINFLLDQANQYSFVQDDVWNNMQEQSQNSVEVRTNDNKRENDGKSIRFPFHHDILFK